MTPVTTHTLDDRGALVLPEDWRSRYGLAPGSEVSLIDLGDGSLLLVPVLPKVSRLVEEITQAMRDAGFTAEAVLAALDEERQRLDEAAHEDET